MLAILQICLHKLYFIVCAEDCATVMDAGKDKVRSLLNLLRSCSLLLSRDPPPCRPPENMPLSLLLEQQENHSGGPEGAEGQRCGRAALPALP